MGKQKQLHVLAVPFPAQGHVKPLLRFSYKLAQYGIKVTFVNTHFIHAKFGASLISESDQAQSTTGLRFVSIPDGLDPDDDRTDLTNLIASLKSVVAGHLETLITNIIGNDDAKITCVITDATLWTKLDFATNMGIKEVVFLPSGAGCSALVLHIPNLIEQGIVDVDGNILKNEVIRMSKKSYPFSCSDLPWRFPGYPPGQKLLFDSCASFIDTMKSTSLILCNTIYELDPWACDLIPNVLPVGPLLSSNLTSASDGNFWLEDKTSLSWLDKQGASSVVYVSFGSLAILSQRQFSELALGLENLGRPFMWVVRSGLIMNGSIAEYPKGFLERVGDRGKIVEWAPQEKVLAHPSVGCFLSHCGWNSTLEGLSIGVPFLCWPYFVDQFQNQTYICDIWKVGLKLNADEDGIMSSIEIVKKTEDLLGHEEIKANVVKLKEMARKSVNEEGSSFENLHNFLKYLND